MMPAVRVKNHNKKSGIGLYFIEFIYLCSPKLNKSAGAWKLQGHEILYASRSNVIEYKMYAIVEIAGQQFKVEEGKKIFVQLLDLEEGKKIDFDQVLLIEDEGKITIGEPVIKDAFVEGKVIDQVRGDKVIVFKKKRKKGYRIKNGHRQNFTRVEIVSINGKTTLKKQAVKKEVPEAAAEPAGETEAVEKKTGAKKTTAKKPEAGEKKTADKKSAENKPAAKKAETKKSAKGKA
jgi:large subunit ribosomal protein L21